VVEHGPGTLLGQGFAPVANLEVCFYMMPAMFHKVGHAGISEEGYHFHDTHLQPVSAQEPGRCYATWTRTRGADDEIVVAYFKGDSKAKGKGNREETSEEEEDTGKDKGNHKGKDKGKGKDEGKDDDNHIELCMLQPVPLTFHHHPTIRRKSYFDQRLLGVDSDACPWSGTCALYHDGVRTEIILRLQAGGSYEVLWCQEDDVELRKAFNGTLLFTQAFFARGHVYALATCTIAGKKNRRTTSKVFLEGIIDKGAASASAQAPRLKFERWCKQSEVVPARSYDELNRMHADEELVGMDAEGTGLWLQVRGHDVVVLPFDTLEARCCLCVDNMALQLPGKCRKVCLDPLTRDLYLLQDRAMEKLERGMEKVVRGGLEDWEIEQKAFSLSREVPSLSVYRVRPAGHLTYNGSRAQLICCTDLGIDSSFGPFCLTSCAWYVEASDALVILDAKDRVWSLPLADARLQDPIEEPRI